MQPLDLCLAARRATREYLAVRMTKDIRAWSKAQAKMQQAVIARDKVLDEMLEGNKP